MFGRAGFTDGIYNCLKNWSGFVNDLVEQIKENIYTEGFYIFYNERRDRVLGLSRALGSESLNVNILTSLATNLEDPEWLFEFLVEEVRIIFDMLVDQSKPAVKRIDYVSELTDVPFLEIAHLLYLLEPTCNPPVPVVIRDRLGDSKGYLGWIKTSKKILESFIDDYTMLESAITYVRDMRNLEDLTKGISEADFTDIKKLKKLRDYFQSLSTMEQRDLVSTRVRHPYVWAAITRKKAKPVVIDGSNVVFSMREHADLKRLDELFFKMANLGVALFPHHIVFDANIRYKVRGYQQEALEGWLRLSQVETYSPADDRIIHLARNRKACVISYDRYLDYDTKGIKLIKPEELNANCRF